MRSGQAWKIRASRLAVACGYALLFIALVGPRHWGGVSALLGTISLVVGLLMPALVRCRVCGLRLQSSTYARGLSIGDRTQWITTVELCPVCGDDGLALPDSQVRWAESGRSEDPYWSGKRLLIASLLMTLLIGGAALLRSFYRVG